MGFELILKENALGLYVARAQGIIEWLPTTAADGAARVDDVRFTALCHLRLFLGPMYA